MKMGNLLLNIVKGGKIKPGKGSICKDRVKGILSFFDMTNECICLFKLDFKVNMVHEAT